MNKKCYLLDIDDDENEVVNWINDFEDEYNIKKFFNCGCCDNCLCDDNIKCRNCGCNCNGDDMCDDFSYDDNSIASSDDNNDINNINNIDINIIKDIDNKKIIRITLQLDMLPDDKKNKIINIDLDINNNTYLELFEELFK